MKKTILALLVVLGATSTLSAEDTGDTYKYLSFVTGKLDYDRTVHGNKNDSLIQLDDEDQLLDYDHAYLAGIDYTWLKRVPDTSMLLGVNPKILFHQGEFYKGGFANINFLAGVAFSDFKLYGNYGVGINSLSKYTVSKGNNYGLTARLDFSEKFSASINYNFYDFGDEDNNDDYQVEGALFGLALKF